MLKARLRNRAEADEFSWLIADNLSLIVVVLQHSQS
jgi:hypothetical protein